MSTIPEPIESGFKNLRSFFEGADGIHPDLKKEAGTFIDAILNPQTASGHDLRSGLMFLIHVLEGSRWQIAEFARVISAHEFLSEAIKASKEEDPNGGE